MLRSALLVLAPAVALALPSFGSSSSASASSSSRHLIETAPFVRNWVDSPKYKENALAVGYFDLTSLHERGDLALLDEASFAANDYAAVVPDMPRQGTAVNRLIPLLSSSLLNDTVSTLAAYKTRNYQSAEAVEASDWLLGRFEAAARSAGRLGVDASVRLFPHSWKQPSVIATIKGTLYPDEVRFPYLCFRFLLRVAHGDNF
jgi:hypothetical protein